jgi:hypothetical protein
VQQAFTEHHLPSNSGTYLQHVDYLSGAREPASEASALLFMPRRELEANPVRS